MKRFVLGTALAAVAMFVWGFLFWAVPWPNPAFDHLDPGDEVALWEGMRDHVPETGVYFFPDVQREGGMDAAAARHAEGPLATLIIQTEGAPMMSPWIFAAGFVHMLLASILIGLALRVAAPEPGGYGRRVGFAALIGLAAALWANLGEPIWNYHPWVFEVTNFVYDWTSWIVAGLVLAWFLRPAAEAASA